MIETHYEGPQVATTLEYIERNHSCIQIAETYKQPILCKMVTFTVHTTNLVGIFALHINLLEVL